MADDAVPRLSVVVEAGGASSRMGTNKAQLSFGGQALIERVLARVAPVACELVVVTARPEEVAWLTRRSFSGRSVRIAPDVPGPAGALRGIASGLAAARCPAVAIVACDMPFVSASLLERLAARLDAGGADVCVPRTPAGIEPLCSVWRRIACVDAARAALARDAQRIRFLLDELSTCYVDAASLSGGADRATVARWFMNVNTPAELAAAAALVADDDAAG